MEDSTDPQEILLIKIQGHLLDSLQLTLAQLHESEGEVCQLNSGELRPEFRITYTQNDVLDYLYALQRHPELVHGDFLPADNGVFWDRVQLGRKLRKLEAGR